jgi:hypothetical protein
MKRHQIKLQIPSSNIQRNIKLQALIHQPPAGLMLGVWNFSGAWMLVLGIFPSVNFK